MREDEGLQGRQEETGVWGAKREQDSACGSMEQMELSDRGSESVPQTVQSQVLKILHTAMLLARQTYSNIITWQSKVAK